jgi:hypothetical protein
MSDRTNSKISVRKMKAPRLPESPHRDLRRAEKDLHAVKMSETDFVTLLAALH